MRSAVFRYAHFLLIPAVVLLLFPSQWTALGFLAALALPVCRWIVLGSPFPQTELNLPLLLLLAAVALGLVISPAKDLGVVTVAQVVAGMMVLFMLADRLRTESDLWHAAAALVGLGVLFSLAAPSTVDLHKEKLFAVPVSYAQLWPRLPEASNPNILAGAVAPIVPLALAMVIERERQRRLLGAIALAPMIGMLVLLQSRGALFALVIGLGFLITTYRRWLLPLVPLALVGVLAANNLVSQDTVGQLFYGRIGTSTIGTLVQRQDLWLQGLYLIRQSPITGIGMGAYPIIAPFAWPYSAASPGVSTTHVHNLFLQVALDAGALGFGAFAVMLLIVARSAWQSRRVGHAGHLPSAMLAALVVVIIHGLGDVIVWGTAKSSIVLWVLLGLGIGLGRVLDTSTKGT